MRNAIKTRLNARRPSIARGTLYGRSLRDRAIDSLRCAHYNVRQNIEDDKIFNCVSVWIGRQCYPCSVEG